MKLKQQRSDKRRARRLTKFQTRKLDRYLTIKRLLANPSSQGFARDPWWADRFPKSWLTEKRNNGL